jgi:ubiquinone biosynthesis protein COQ9
MTDQADTAPGRDPAGDSAPDWAEAAEARVLEAALAIAPDTGWNSRLVTRATRAAGLTRGEAELLLPNGARDLAALAAARHLRRTFEMLDGLDPSTLKVRERIRRAASAKVDATMEDGAAARRLAGYLALPHNVPFGLKLFWDAADALWRWAGDTAVDENHYTKRAILGGVLMSTLAVRLRHGRDAARMHLDDRIENVMAFERWKAGLKPPRLGERLAHGLAALRYRSGGG